MTASSFINSDIGANFKSIDAGSNTGVSTTLPWTPGYEVDGNQFGSFVYVQAGSAFGAGGLSVIDGYAVTFDNTFTASPLTNTSAAGKVGQFVGIVRTAGTIATGNGFWVQVCGQANVSVAASTTSYTFLSTTAVGGQMTSTVTAGTNYSIQGVVVNAAVGGSAGVVEGTLNYPYIAKAN